MTKLAGLLWKRHKYASAFKVVQPHNPYNHNIPNWVPDGTIGVALPRGARNWHLAKHGSHPHALQIEWTPYPKKTNR